MLPDSTKRTVVQALVTSRLDYGNIHFFLGANKDVIRKLQVVQNAAACLLCRIPKTTSASSSLHELHWLKVENCIKFKTLTYMFKIKTGRTPQCLNSIVKPYVPSRPLDLPTMQNSRSRGTDWPGSAADLFPTWAQLCGIAFLCH